LLRQALSAVGRSLLDLWENILVLATANIVWALSLLPGVFVGSLIKGGLLIFVLAFLIMTLLAGPTTIGMFYMTADTSRRERIELSDFWTGIKRYYRRGWLLAGINSLFILLVVFNLVFYSQPGFSDSPIRLMYIVWVYVILTWFMLQLYLWPLAIRMEPEGRLPLRLLLRNALLAMFKYIGFSLIVGLITLLILIGSVVAVLIPMVLFGMALYGLISNRAAKMVLVRENERAAAENVQATPLTPIIDTPLEITRPVNEKAVALEVETRNPPPGITRRGL